MVKIAMPTLKEGGSSKSLPYHVPAALLRFEKSFTILPYLQKIFARKFWKRGMWFGLIPKCYRRYVILQRQITPSRAPPQSLYGHLQVLLKSDGIHDMPAIEPKSLLGVVKPVRTDHLC